MKSETIEAGPPLARCPASKRDRLGSSINSANNPTANSAQVCLRATDRRIHRNGGGHHGEWRYAGAGTLPTTSCCGSRSCDPHRGAMVALRVRSIGEAARLVVKTSGNGVPIFAVQEGRRSPLMRAIEGDRRSEMGQTSTKDAQRKAARYLRLFHWMMASPAWNSLSPIARAVYIQLAARYMGSNNGRIPFSVREDVADLQVSKSTVHRSLLELVDRGFIVPLKRGAFSLKLKHATEWRLTEHTCDVTHRPASKASCAGSR